MAKTFTTGQAAKLIGVSRATLHAWIAGRKVLAPEPVPFGPTTVRRWTESDIARLRRDKRRLYRANMGRPKEFFEKK